MTAPTKDELLRLCKCSECPLNKQFNPVFGEGPEQANLIMIGEAPGYYEQNAGRPFTGPIGKLINNLLRQMGSSRDKVYLTNTTLCKAPTPSGSDSAPPPLAAVHACSARLHAEIASRNPKVITAMGATAANALLGTKGKISDVAGAITWSDDYQAFIIPSVHPASLFHGAGASQFEDIVDALYRSIKFADGRLPLPNRTSEIKYQYIEHKADVYWALQDIQARGTSGVPIAIDTETDGLRYLTDRLICVSISDGTDSWVIDAEPLLEDPTNKRLMASMFRDEKILWICHNLKFDQQILRYNFDYYPMHAVDTMAYALGLTERGQGVGLKRLSRSYLNEPYYEAQLKSIVKVEGDDNGKFSVVPKDILAEYAARDARNTARLYQILVPLVKEEGTEQLVTTLLIPAAKAFADMEYRGMRVDMEQNKKLESLWLPKVQAATTSLQEFADSKGFDASKVVKKPKKGDIRLNVNSHPQLAHLIYDILGYEEPPKKTHKSADRTTGKEFRAFYPNEPITLLLEEFATLDHLLKSYVYGIADDVWPDGRVHPDFKLAGTVTGRLAIQDPPMQTLPKNQVNPELAALLRRQFIPTDGYVFIECDFRQLELRVGWHLSGDENMGKALMAGDFHTNTAAKIFDVPIGKITKQQRTICKAVSFGVMYNRQAPSLAKGELNCDVGTAQKYIDDWFAEYPTLREWLLDQQAEALKNQELTTSFGRKRRWGYKSNELLQEIMNQAVNFPVQCVPVGTKVWTENGHKNIECIERGESVRTSSGFHPVKDIWTRHVETEIVKLRVAGCNDVEFTPEHPIWVKPEGDDTWQWKMPRTVLVGDKVCVPRYIPIHIDNIDGLHITPELANVCGWYLAEGRYDKTNRAIVFTMHEDELEYADTLCRDIDVVNDDFLSKGYEHRRGKSAIRRPNPSSKAISVRLGSKLLGEWLVSNFGLGSTNKHVPSWVFDSPVWFIESLLAAYVTGDGCYTGSNWTVTTKSEQLAYDVQILLNILGHSVRVMSREHNFGYPTLYPTQYLLNFGVYRREHQKSVDRFEDHYECTVQEVSTKQYEGTVYNLHVEEEHEFCVPYITHNSVASDMCLSSLIKLHKMLPERGWGDVILTIHDALLFEIKPEFIQPALLLIREVMCNPDFETKAVFDIDATVGLNWGDMHEVEKESDG